MYKIELKKYRLRILLLVMASTAATEAGKAAKAAKAAKAEAVSKKGEENATMLGSAPRTADVSGGDGGDPPQDKKLAPKGSSPKEAKVPKRKLSPEERKARRLKNKERKAKRRAYALRVSDAEIEEALDQLPSETQEAWVARVAEFVKKERRIRRAAFAAGRRLAKKNRAVKLAKGELCSSSDSATSGEETESEGEGEGKGEGKGRTKVYRKKRIT